MLYMSYLCREYSRFATEEKAVNATYHLSSYYPELTRSFTKLIIINGLLPVLIHIIKIR